MAKWLGIQIHILHVANNTESTLMNSTSWKKESFTQGPRDQWNVKIHILFNFTVTIQNLQCNIYLLYVSFTPERILLQIQKKTRSLTFKFFKKILIPNIIYVYIYCIYS